MRRLGTTLTMLATIVGLLLSLGSIPVLWRAASVFSQRVMNAADVAGDVTERASWRVGHADERLSDLQANVTELRTNIDRIADGDEPVRLTPALQKLDASIVRGLEQSRTVLLSLQSSTQMLSQTVVALDSLSSPLKRLRTSRSDEAATGEEKAGAVQLSETLADTSVLIERVIESISLLEDQTITPEQINQLQDTLQRLQERTGESQDWLKSLEAQLRETHAQVVAIREDVSFWSHTMAAVGTVFLFCFALTQLHLIGHSRTVLSTPAASD